MNSNNIIICASITIRYQFKKCDLLQISESDELFISKCLSNFLKLSTTL